jgi:hypothetical protein
VTLTVADQISGEIAMAVAGDVTGPADGEGRDQPAAAGQTAADAKR